MTLNAQFIGGVEVENLESRLQKYLNVNYAITCANGTDAIQLALRAVGVGFGDLVLVPNVTFWATFEAVVNVGAKPVTVDANINDGGVDIGAFKQAIIECKPKAAVIAHLYGWGSGNLLELREICEIYGVILVEDGAQAFGVLYDGKSIFEGAHISTTSFYPAKVLGAAGDGGAVFTNKVELAEKVRRLGNHGRTAHYGYGDVGWNSRLDSLQAAFLNLSLDNITSRITSRRRAINFYKQKLSIPGVQIIEAPNRYEENGYCNVCLIENQKLKTTLENELRVNGIGFGNIYPGVMSGQVGAGPYLARHYGGKTGERLCNSVLNLPVFPYMKTEELEMVAQVVEKTIKDNYEC